MQEGKTFLTLPYSEFRKTGQVKYGGEGIQHAGRVNSVMVSIIISLFLVEWDSLDRKGLLKDKCKCTLLEGKKKGCQVGKEEWKNRRMESRWSEAELQGLNKGRKEWVTDEADKEHPE